jgi:hypothetical protein
MVGRARRCQSASGIYVSSIDVNLGDFKTLRQMRGYEKVPVQPMVLHAASWLCEGRRTQYAVGGPLTPDHGNRPTTLEQDMGSRSGASFLRAESEIVKEICILT